MLRASSVLGDTCSRAACSGSVVASRPAPDHRQPTRLQRSRDLGRHRQSQRAAKPSSTSVTILLRQTYGSIPSEARKTAHHDAALSGKRRLDRNRRCLQRGRRCPHPASYYLRAQRNRPMTEERRAGAHCAWGLRCSSGSPALRGSLRYRVPRGFLAKWAGHFACRDERPAHAATKDHHWLCAISTGITCAAARDTFASSDLAVLSASVPSPIRSGVRFSRPSAWSVVTLLFDGSAFLRSPSPCLRANKTSSSPDRRCRPVFAGLAALRPSARGSLLSPRVESALTNYQTAIDAFVRIGSAVAWPPLPTATWACSSDGSVWSPKPSAGFAKDCKPQPSSMSR